METAAGIITTLFGLYLIALLIATLLKKNSVVKFFSSFAVSAKAHYTEQLLRMMVGSGLVVYSKKMLYPELFEIFGWVLIVTTALLLVMPWQWHYRFGKWAIPFMLKNLFFYAVFASLMGLVILYCVIAPLI
jgi:hypothetical protein